MCANDDPITTIKQQFNPHHTNGVIKVEIMCCNHHNSYRKASKWHRHNKTATPNNNCKSAVSEITDTTDKGLQHTINDNYYCANCPVLSQVAATTTTTETSPSMVVGNNNMRTMDMASRLLSCCLASGSDENRKTVENDMIFRNKSNYSKLLSYLMQNNKHYYYFHHHWNDKPESNATQLNYRARSNTNGFTFVLLILMIITCFCIDFTTAGKLRLLASI